MKLHVTAFTHAGAKPVRVADVCDILTGQALIRGLLPLRKHDGYLIRQDATRGKNAKPSQIVTGCRVSPAGEWIMDGPDGKIIASGKLA